MNADGSERRLLARNLAMWPGHRTGGRSSSCAGAARGRGATKAYAVVMNADGSGLRTLTRIAQVNGALPSWSPDGRKIVFVSDRDGNLEIYVMNADGSGRET